MGKFPDIEKYLKKYFGFETFKGRQREIVTSLLEGRDVFVLMPTGGGKSLCYQLPALVSEGTAIIISPLIALMKNQVDMVRHLGEEASTAHFFNSTLGRAAARRVKTDVLSGKTKMLYVAPETLAKPGNIDFFRQINVSFYAIDEAHCISEWGHDFRPEYRRIREVIDMVGRRPVIALTATATPKVQHDILRNLAILDADVFKSSFNRKNLYYEVREKTVDIDRDIIRFIRNHAGKSGIIYCLSRKKVMEVAEILNLNGIKALPYHAGMDAQRRSANQDAFLMEEVDVIVATVAFGMGIDKPDVRYVIHYDIPKSLEGYYQETGRAGRDDGEGICIAYYSPKDIYKLDKLLQGKSASEQEIGRQLLAETASYAESSRCRRKLLLNYFGEDFQDQNCGNCDNCRHPKVSIEASAQLKHLLETILILDQKYKQPYIESVVSGVSTPESRKRGHEELGEFGILEEFTPKFVNTLMEKAISAGLLINDPANYGILQLSPTGLSFLSNPEPFIITESRHHILKEDAEPENRVADDEIIITSTTSGSEAGGAADNELFAILRDIRKTIARKNNVPPYVILQDPTLETMATLYPVSEEEFSNIPGVGESKAKHFSGDFLPVIRKYVEDNDIMRPTELKVRTVADKSKTKYFIIQGIDRKIDLETLAESKGLEFPEFLDALEAIVEEGTKINIDYYLQSILEPECREEILDYFRSSDSDNLEEAFQDLGSDYTLEELRLMHIKFLSSWFC